MAHPELCKCRSLPLADAAQVMQAAQCLSDTLSLQVLPLPQQARLIIAYDLHHISLEEIGECLRHAGIRLADHWLSQAQFRVTCFCEEIERDNLHLPAVNTKGREAFGHVYQQQPHGDQDDTPEDLRLER